MNRNICRVCLKKGMLSNIFSEDKWAPCVMIMECTNVKLSREEPFPSLICQDCLNNLKVSFQFKRLCESSDYELRKVCCNTNLGDQGTNKSIKVECDDTSEFEYLDIPDHTSYTKSESVKNELDGVTKCTIKKSKIRKKKVSKATNGKSVGGVQTKQECPECGKVFRYSGYLESHLKTHRGEKPFVCEICQRGFTQKTNLIIHSRTHTGEKPFQCEICSKTFSTISNLSSHQLSHLEERPHQCVHCSKKYKSKKLLKSHLVTHSDEKKYECKTCGKRFGKTTYLTTHVRSVHLKTKNYKCSSCGKAFANASNLTAHFRIHTGEKPYVCDKCGACFNQSSALQTHKKGHLKENTKTHKANRPQVVTSQNL